MTAGNITRRGKSSWRLKFDVGRDPVTGKREIRYHTFRGTKRDAAVKLAELVAAAAGGSYVEPSKITVAEFVRSRVDQWEASGQISARTAQRYRQLVENQIVPHLGTAAVQKLRPLDIEAWHTTLREAGRARSAGGISARTIGHAHRVLGKALAEAVKNDMVTRNVCQLETAPKVVEKDMVIVHDVPAFLAMLTGRLRAPAMIALFTGMRLGEVLALRWNRVDLEGKVIQVREAIEHTRTHGIRFKAPKSRAGRRDITLPDVLVDALRDHWRSQLELRLKLGVGRLPDDAMLFSDLEGEPPSPNAYSSAWGDFAKAIGMPDVTFHALRHTHASTLIDAGVDIVTISRRLGHAKPDITLRVYAHMFQKDDSKAAAAINAAF
ncbi:MAG: site-specific integrase [Bauldia sp.]|nr:site-specific integrase [Bauldia sp.]